MTSNALDNASAIKMLTGVNPELFRRYEVETAKASQLDVKFEQQRKQLQMLQDKLKAINAEHVQEVNHMYSYITECREDVDSMRAREQQIKVALAANLNAMQYVAGDISSVQLQLAHNFEDKRILHDDTIDPNIVFQDLPTPASDAEKLLELLHVNADGGKHPDDAFSNGGVSDCVQGETATLPAKDDQRRASLILLQNVIAALKGETEATQLQYDTGLITVEKFSACQFEMQNKKEEARQLFLSLCKNTRDEFVVPWTLEGSCQKSRQHKQLSKKVEKLRVEIEENEALFDGPRKEFRQRALSHDVKRFEESRRVVNDVEGEMKDGKEEEGIHTSRPVQLHPCPPRPPLISSTATLSKNAAPSSLQRQSSLRRPRSASMSKYAKVAQQILEKRGIHISAVHDKEVTAERRKGEGCTSYKFATHEHLVDAIQGRRPRSAVVRLPHNSSIVSGRKEL